MTAKKSLEYNNLILCAMKKIILTSLLFIVLSCATFAQGYTISISGYVTNIATNVMIPNQMVTISSDSTIYPYFAYHTVVTTNASGIFYAVIPMTVPTVQIKFIITTSDCNGGVVTQNLWTTPGYSSYNIGLFTNCGNTGSPCVAGFTSTPCTNAN